MTFQYIRKGFWDPGGGGGWENSASRQKEMYGVKVLESCFFFVQTKILGRE